MSKLYSSVSSDTGKTESTKRGHKLIRSHVRTWTVGVKILAEFDKESGKSKFHIFKTGGSHNPESMTLIQTIEE
jgi:hypothetical protein